MHQPKINSKVSPYSATSPNARRNITKSFRGHGVIVTIGWRVVVSIFALNCRHIQAVVQEMQAVAKTAPLQQQQITRSLLGGMQLLKQLQTSIQSITMFQ